MKGCIAAVVIQLLCLLVHAQSDEVRWLQSRANDSLLWGSWRPNLFMGMRPRLPSSLMTGVMWMAANEMTDLEGLRHDCEQGDDIGAYGWTEHDPRRGGKQVISDTRNGYKLTMEMSKSLDGKSWGLRVSGELLPTASLDSVLSLFFYIGTDRDGAFLDMNGDPSPDGVQDPVIAGSDPQLGDFDVSFALRDGQAPQTTHPVSGYVNLEKFQFASANVPSGMLWKAKAILTQLIRGKAKQIFEATISTGAPPISHLYVLPNGMGQGNIQILQKTFEGPFSFDIMFNNKASAQRIDSSELTRLINSDSENFNARFDSLGFKPPFNTPEHVSMAKQMLSNLLGGIGYFYGDSVVDKSDAPEFDELDDNFWEFTQQRLESKEGVVSAPPRELLTAVPSRPFFPRGFYWDEGFHLALIGKWDSDLSLEILRSWFLLMDDNGWIGREQILGDEARSKVPPEFQIQYPHYANPPTLIMALTDYIERLKLDIYGSMSQDGAIDFAAPDNEADVLRTAHLTNRGLAKKYLEDMYPLFKKHYEWFRDTQYGFIREYDRAAYSKSHAYRWRGRSLTHCLTSGLDDYPRPQPPSPGELHVDLMSWMGFFAQNLHDIASYLDLKDDAEAFETARIAIERNILDLHWSEEAKSFCDVGVDRHDESYFACHEGYVSILPMALGLVSHDSPQLHHVLEHIHDPDRLWTPYGLRSLSKSDEFFHTGENYWRGPIWVNMNYLVLSSLYKNYIQKPGPNQKLAQTVYNELRSNIVKTVLAEWKRTGIIWEQYNDETGHGQRTKAFTGWTSLIVNVMSESY